MMDIRLGDEVHFVNGETARVVEVNKLYGETGFHLDLLTPVHGFINRDFVSEYWYYDPEGKIRKEIADLEGNDIVSVVHKGTDDFFHLYKGDVIITSNGSEAKVIEDAVLMQRYTIVLLSDKININTDRYKPRRVSYINVRRDNLEISSLRGPNTRIIKVIRGDRNEDLHGKSG